jgi:hypothetical protein
LVRLAACGRNPLVRAVDRLELLVIAQSQMRRSATATATNATAAGASMETRVRPDGGARPPRGQ